MYTFELCLIGIYVFDAEGVRKIDILENPKLIFLRTQQLPKSTEMGGEKTVPDSHGYWTQIDLLGFGPLPSV